jgi:hypothetical protein
MSLIQVQNPAYWRAIGFFTMQGHLGEINFKLLQRE